MRIHPNTESDLILTESEWIQGTTREEFEMWNEEWKREVLSYLTFGLPPSTKIPVLH